MNRDEKKMIEEMARVLCNKKCGECEYIPRLCGYKSYCTRLYNAGCRIVGEDEQIVKTEQLNETLNSTLESGKRMGYERGRDETIVAVLKYIDNTIEDVNREKEECKYEDEDEKSAQLIIADAINVVLKIVRDDLARIYGIEIEEE